MKKVTKIIYSALFFGMCATPLVMLPFSKNSGELEKKELAKMPSVIKDGSVNKDFSEEFEGWFNDNLPMRSQLLTGANFVKSNIFKSPSGNVIVGKDGWLFYESTVPDFMNTNAMSEHDLKSIVVTLSLLQENVESKGGKFLFAPTPNKNSIYGEYMPVFYTKAKDNNLSRLYEYLEQSDVNYVNLKQFLIEKKDMMIYHTDDTHWTNLGALLSYNEMMNSLDREHKTYDGVSYKITDDWRGDLDKLLYPAYNASCCQYEFDIDYDEFSFVMPAGVTDTKAQLDNFMSDKEDGDNRFKTSRKDKDTGRNLYMVRDSFGRALLPFMIDNYDTAMFVRTICPEMNMVQENTDMIYEIVERNLCNLIKTAPFMMSPQRADIEASKVVESDKNYMLASDEGYAYRIYGTIDESMVSEDTRVYVKLESEDNEYIFEAFPVYEEELLKNEDTKSKAGYSMMFNSSEIKEGTYEVSVISGNNSSGIIKEITIGGK